MTKTPDAMSSSSLPIFRNNLNHSSRYKLLRNNIKQYSLSSESGESSSSCSRQSSIDSIGNNSDAGRSSSSADEATIDWTDLGRSIVIPGPKYKLVHEGNVQVCTLNNTKTIVTKILNSKYLRRWESHHLFLTSTEINSKSRSGSLSASVPYGLVQEVFAPAAANLVCLSLPDRVLLLQMNSAYVRNQWLYSIAWKRNMLKFRKLLSGTRRSEVFYKELKNLVDLSLCTPLQDECIYNTPLDQISDLLRDGLSWLPRSTHEEIVASICPLLELAAPSPEIADLLALYCRDNPRSRTVLEMFTPIVQRILKHNMDFGKYPKTKLFVQEYIQALSYQNESRIVIEKFISSVHGVSSVCPHPRVLPNLISVCLSAIQALYEEKSRWASDQRMQRSDWESRLLAFISVLEFSSSHEDWLPQLAQLLQPTSFPEEALSDPLFTKAVSGAVRRAGMDARCEVHSAVATAVGDNACWLRLLCPGAPSCPDEGQLWSDILSRLLSCCGRRRAFLTWLGGLCAAVVLLALRGDGTAQQALAALLEAGVLGAGEAERAAEALQATPSGKTLFAQLTHHLQDLRELQQKGGPRKFTLPGKSTDADVRRLVGCGTSLGNLECLSLACTQVTSACAEHLAKLPGLKYLNLWSTQFGDAGLQLISERLPQLQVLNLCETPVTDEGLLCLANLQNLRKLNLNSTKLTAQTFEILKQKLPALQECDIRYTDAW